MPTPVATVNTPRLVALGLSRALESFGYEIERADDPGAWAATHPEGVVVVTVRDRRDVDVVVDLTIDPSIPVVAMLDSMTTDQILQCLAAGARACVSPDWSGDELALALEASRHGLAILPAVVVRTIVWINPDHERTLTATQTAWLRDLASGSTVQALADRVGFSEREMYRRLSQVYHKMGCSSRTEALVRASSSGMFDHPRADRPDDG